MSAKKKAVNRGLRATRKKAATAPGHLRRPEKFLRGLTNHCFGCSPENRHGLHLKFSENTATCSVECVFRAARRFEGPPGHVHGGVIATILDEAMGKVNRQKGVVALTRRMSIDYLRPVPLGTKLRAVGWAERQEGRKHFHIGEIRTLDGEVLARSEGLFVAIDVKRMFEKHLRG
jgi:uncharacterized protein (TIGR00369 family)